MKRTWKTGDICLMKTEAHTTPFLPLVTYPSVIYHTCTLQHHRSLSINPSFPLSSNPFICVSFSFLPHLSVFYPSITPSAFHYLPQPHPVLLSAHHSIFFPPFSVSHSTFLLSRSLMSTASIPSLSLSCTVEFIWGASTLYPIWTVREMEGRVPLKELQPTGKDSQEIDISHNTVNDDTPQRL